MIEDLCKKIGIPDKSTEFLSECLTKLLSDGTCCAKLCEAQDELFSGGTSYDSMLDELAEISGIHKYSVYLTFVLYSARTLKYIYLAKGLPDEIFYASIGDITCKYNECMTVYGVCGISPVMWYRRFFLCKLFSFGRLELGIGEFRLDSYRDGILKRGDLVFDCHIPSGGNFTPEAVLDSLKKAYAFFCSQGVISRGDVMNVTCHSWLLYPENKELFTAHGNVAKFIELFDIIESAPEPENPNFWRIFGKNYDGNMEDVPRDTSMRRSFADHIASGGCMGIGYGVLGFDGNKIVH